MDLGGSRQGKGLGGNCVGGGGKVEIVFVDEEVEGFRGGGGVRGADEERVEFEDAGETIHIKLAAANIHRNMGVCSCFCFFVFFFYAEYEKSAGFWVSHTE